MKVAPRNFCPSTRAPSRTFAHFSPCATQTWDIMIFGNLQPKSWREHAEQERNALLTKNCTLQQDTSVALDGMEGGGGDFHFESFWKKIEFSFSPWDKWEYFVIVFLFYRFSLKNSYATFTWSFGQQNIQTKRTPTFRIEVSVVVALIMEQIYF